MKNILVFFGEERHLSRQGMEAMVAAYKEKAGDLNFVFFDGVTANVAEIVSQATAMPFLAEKRLVLVENFFSRQKEAAQNRLVSFLEGAPESAVVALWEEGRPKSKNFAKLLGLENCKAEESAKLDHLTLSKWIQRTAARHGGQISVPAANFLVGEVGENLVQLENELAKLVSYDKEVTKESIQKLVVGNRFANVFDMVDAFGARKPQKALLEMHRLLETGESEMYVLSMVVRQFRNIVMAKDLRSKGLVEKEIAAELGLHPFVVKKTLAQASSFSFSDLRQAYGLFVAAERGIKTGESPRLVLDLLAARLKH